ncbi:L,D-transpeptidase family protein [Paratractidigestivibacter faecalis]|uniref:L,D-transpeptidase family protein n=1 Tax=Paratractidigestivibacter faecalis TaxID=2292441 RepID=UPI003A9594AF
MRRTTVRAFLAIPVMALAVTLSLSPAAGLQRALADDAPDNVIEAPGDSRPKDDEPATPEGWREESGKRTYWRDGQMLTGIQTVDGVDYLFGEDGAMTTGWGIDPKTGSWCYADADGALRTGWLQKNGSWYLLGADHLMLTGWQQEGGSTYYLDGSGAMQTQWALVDGGWYWLGTSGALHTGWAWLGNNWYYLDLAQNGRTVTDGAAQVDGTWYAFDTSGHMASSGWALTGGSWYLAEGSGALKTGWQRANGTWYYLSPADAKMATGDTVVDGKSYHLDDSGAMVASTWVRDAAGVWRWYGADGALVATIDGLDVTFADGSVKSGLTQVGSTWYLLETNVIQTGEQVVDGKTHLFDEKTGEAVVGWQKSADGSWLHYDAQGAAQTGWVRDGSWYYLDPETGIMQTGWVNVDGTWYLLSGSGAMRTGWNNVGGTWYLMGSSGAMRTGWAWDGSAWYYLESWGGMHTGWLSLNGTWYFLDYDGGYMHTGWTWAGGQYYWFNEDGSLGSIDCAWWDMLQWAQSYYSSTNWLMLTDTSGCRTAIYYGHHGAWRPVKELICSTGAPATPTVTGEFTVTGKGYSFGNGFTCYYYTQFYGDYLYHSVLYYQNSFRVMDGRLGMHLSHGCVRLDIDNAKWIYDNIPYGTKVVIW